jgi:hypothetical protein
MHPKEWIMITTYTFSWSTWVLPHDRLELTSQTLQMEIEESMGPKNTQTNG